MNGPVAEPASLARLHLLLYFSRGVSLAQWQQTGLLERETALYAAMAPHLGQITFVTYGHGHDRHIARSLPHIRVFANGLSLPEGLHARLPAWLPPRGPAIIKTNQVAGGHFACFAARWRKQPLIARCGYMPSDFGRRRFGEDSPQFRAFLAEERHLFRAAQAVVVTTEVMARYVVDVHGIAENRVRVIPNYVDTERFAPTAGAGGPGNRLLSIGRLRQGGQKNLFALVEALGGLDVELWIAGDGPERQALAQAAEHHATRVRFLGDCPHGQLPALLNQADAFILPSLYEGHPKALIEAMACGRPILASDVSGIREVIRSGHTGLLVPPTAAGLRRGVQDLLKDPQAMARMGAAARQEALDRYALSHVVTAELALYAQLTEG